MTGSTLSGTVMGFMEPAAIGKGTSSARPASAAK
jgi:hypothetical protein